jgi:hypothetical protein
LFLSYFNLGRKGWLVGWDPRVLIFVFDHSRGFPFLNFFSRRFRLRKLKIVLQIFCSQNLEMEEIRHQSVTTLAPLLHARMPSSPEDRP